MDTDMYNLTADHQPGAESAAGEKASGLLRGALLGNAAFSSLVAVVCIIGAQPIALWLGIANPAALAAFGVVILAFAPFVLWVATRHPLNLPGPTGHMA